MLRRARGRAFFAHNDNCALVAPDRFASIAATRNVVFMPEVYDFSDSEEDDRPSPTSSPKRTLGLDGADVNCARDSEAYDHRTNADAPAPTLLASVVQSWPTFF